MQPEINKTINHMYNLTENYELSSTNLVFSIMLGKSFGLCHSQYLIVQLEKMVREDQ